MYSGYGIVFTGLGSGISCDDFARSFVIFGVDNSSSSHTDYKNNFLVLHERPTDNIKGSIGAVV